VLERHRDPTVDGFLAPAALWAYCKNPLHRALHEIPGTSMGAVQIRNDSLAVQAQDQIVMMHSAAHVTCHHKREPAEHTFLHDIVSPLNARHTRAASESS